MTDNISYASRWVKQTHFITMGILSQCFKPSEDGGSLGKMFNLLLSNPGRYIKISHHIYKKTETSFIVDLSKVVGRDIICHFKKRCQQVPSVNDTYCS